MDLSNQMFPAGAARDLRVPLTVEQYHAMLERGILHDGEPIELLDGLLVRKDRSAVGEDLVTVNPLHAGTVTRLAHLDEVLRRHGAHLRQQQPIELPPHHEPEPDGAIIRGPAEAFLDRHPGAEDTLVLIEVADSSLEHDRTTKLRIYATAGVPQYVIVNLRAGVLELYEDPVPARAEYGRVSVVDRDGSFGLRLGDGATPTCRALDWLPPRR